LFAGFYVDLSVDAVGFHRFLWIVRNTRALFIVFLGVSGGEALFLLFLFIGGWFWGYFGFYRHKRGLFWGFARALKCLVVVGL